MKNLNTKHRIIMSYALTGITQRDIAKKLHMSETRLSVIVNAPLFKAELNRLLSHARSKIVQTSKEVADIYDAAAPTAARKEVSLVDSDDAIIALKAADKVVMRSSFGKQHSDSTRPISLTQTQMVLINEGME